MFISVVAVVENDDISDVVFIDDLRDDNEIYIALQFINAKTQKSLSKIHCIHCCFALE